MLRLFIPQSAIRNLLLLSVHYLPKFVAAGDLAGSTVVVVDLLRASTTICHALRSGAACVVPVLEVDDALKRAEQLGRDRVILGGERGGKLIEGFDLGNSPSEYTPDKVSGRTLIFTTTNGTRALHHAHLADRVLVGSVVNRARIVAAVRDAPRVDILCAGTGGNVTREDILAAGALVAGLLAASPADRWETNEGADAARREWEEIVTSAHANGRTLNDHFARELENTPGGRNLLAIGHHHDLVDCAQLDTLDVVPTWNPHDGRITLR
jgi:2-phosphosulfolactate phosphatase